MSLEVDAAKNGHLFPLDQEQEEKVAHSNDSILKYTPQQTAPQYNTPQQTAPQYGTPEQTAFQYGTPQTAFQYGTPQQTAFQYGTPQHTMLPNVHQIDGRSEPADARISKVRRINILLLVAFVSSLVLAIIAAAVGGSVAVSRQNEITSLKSQLAHNLNGSAALPSNNGTALPSDNSAPLGPISNCTSYSSPFAAHTGGTFDIHCGNDLVGGSAPDILGVYVYTFQDCINACASYNHESLRAVQVGQTQLRPNGTCYAVAWNRALTHDQGNCYLKPAVQVGLSANSTVDTAILNK